MRVYSTCPQSKHADVGDYPNLVAKASRWSEEAGCEGMLIYTDNGLVDPWLVAQLVLGQTARLVPLVAVQPVYMHPYSLAKMVATLHFLYGRSVALNLVAGGFRNDLFALDDQASRDERYRRLVEYAEVVKRLVGGGSPVTYQGRHYQVKNLRLVPEVPEGMRPELFVSGSSDAGTQAAQQLGATMVRYPKAPDEDTGVASDIPAGIRVGIIARSDEEEAWRVAQERFPADRRGQLTHQLAMRTSDSDWHRDLSAMSDRRDDASNPYWLWPFEQYATFCPYLVGSYERVAAEVKRYRGLGYQTLITDIPREPDDLPHAMKAIELASSSP